MTANFKCKLLWEAPEITDGLSAYFVYRKTDTTEYKRIKIQSISHNDYTDNTVHEEGDYYYKVEAFYSDLDCNSAPAAYANNPYQYFVHFYYSPTAVAEHEAGDVKLYPNPTQNQVAVEAQGLLSVEVCNVLGQRVLVKRCSQGDDKMTLDLQGLEPGIYLTRVFTATGVVTETLVKQ